MAKYKLEKQRSNRSNTNQIGNTAKANKGDGRAKPILYLYICSLTKNTKRQQCDRTRRTEQTDR